MPRRNLRRRSESFFDICSPFKREEEKRGKARIALHWTPDKRSNNKPPGKETGTGTISSGKETGTGTISSVGLSSKPLKSARLGPSARTSPKQKNPVTTPRNQLENQLFP